MNKKFEVPNVFFWVILILIPLLTVQSVWGSVVINEVMANALDEDTGEFIELYNNGLTAVDIAAWKLYDPGDTNDLIGDYIGLNDYGISGTLLPAGGYALVVDSEYAGEYQAYLLQYADATNMIVVTNSQDTSLGDSSSGLGNAGDTITLDDGLGYTTAFTWTSDAGNGKSWKKKDPLGDNSATNWNIGNSGGTPGAANNANPAATNDAYATPEDTSLAIIAASGVLTNDTDADGDTLTAAIITDVTQGTLIFSPDGSFTYVPRANFAGTDSFTYRANDGIADSSLATVTITVNNVNDAPTAAADSYSTMEDILLVIAAPGILTNDADVDGDTLTVSVIASPAHGDLILNTDGSGNYSPDTDYHGWDTFTYEVRDNFGGTDQATVTITLTSVNDKPLIERILVDGESDPDEQTVTQLIETILEVEGFDVEGDALAIDYGASTVDFDGEITALSSLTDLTTSPYIQISPQDDLQFTILIGAGAVDYTFNIVLTDGNAENRLSEARELTLYVEPALGIDALIVAGQGADDLEILNVTPGQNISVSFSIENNFDEILNHISIIAGLWRFVDDTFLEVFRQDCTGTSCDSGIWALLPGDNVPISFSYSTPLGENMDALSITSAEEDGFETTMVVPIRTIRDDFAAVITNAIVSPAIVNCSESTTITLDMVNTGENDIPVDILVYDRSKTGFNSLTGEFSSAAGKILEEEITIIRREDVSFLLGINTSSFANGGQQVYIYLVNPGVESFIASTATVPLQINSCIINQTPDVTLLTIRGDEPQEFSVTLADDGFVPDWYLNGTFMGSTPTFSLGAVGEEILPGTYTIKATISQETRQWQVTVNNLPLTTSLTTNLPANPTLDELSRVTNFTVQNSNGKIVFPGTSDLQNIRSLDQVISLQRNLVSVNTTLASELNKAATITLGSFTRPAIFYTGATGMPQRCRNSSAPSCIISSTSPLTFTVSGFSTYTVTEELPADLVITPSSLEVHGPRDQTTSITFSLSNPGTLDSVTGITGTLLDVAGRYNAVLGTIPETLAPGQRTDISLQLHVPENESTERQAIGLVQFTSNDIPNRTAAIFLEPQDFLEITEVNINGKRNGDLPLEEPFDIEVTVENTHSQEIEDMTIIVTILDVDGEDLEEESEEFSLRSDEDDQISFQFDLSDEQVDEEKYTIEIVVEGTAKDGTKQESRLSLSADVDRENHQVVFQQVDFQQVDFSPSQFQCDRQGILAVTIENIGKQDEEEVSIVVSNPALEVEQRRERISIDKFSDNDNDYSTSFPLNFDDAAPGTYPLTVELLRDNNVEESREVGLTIKECSTLPRLEEKQSQVEISGYVQQTEQQLQAALTGFQQPLPQPTVSMSFRETSTYTALLMVVIVLLCLAVLLGLAVAVKK